MKFLIALLSIMATGYIVEAKEIEASFDFNNQCENNLIFFEDRSKADAGKIIAWYWEFGDESVSTDQHPVHVYGSPGKYEVLLIVKNIFNQTDTVLKEIEIKSNPVVLFDIDDTSKKISNTEREVKYIWNFGDGSYSMDLAPCHLYEDIGQYNVELKLMNEAGCVHTFKQTIEFKNSNEIEFTLKNLGGDEYHLLYHEK